MTSIGIYKKCYRCGNTTTDMQKTQCKCGGYLYLISLVYTPKVAKQERKRVG